MSKMWFVMVLCLLCSFDPSSTSPALSCTTVRQLFQLKNISVAVPDQPTNGSGVCLGEASCCTREMEATLQQTVTKELHSLLHHNFQSIHGMLATTASALKEHVRSLTLESENKTLTVFEEVYKRMWSLAKGPISEFYASLLGYLEREGQVLTSVPSEDGLGLQRTVLRFFTDMFPLVYHQAVHHLHAGDFTPEYKSCLKESVERVQPFGEHPRAMAQQVSKSFEATKVLMEALSLGIEVLKATDILVSGLPEEPDSCREALVRLYYCPRCLGLPASIKPCNGYCLNVMRGCLTQQRTTELDLPWSNFLEETERLVRELQSGTTPSIQRVLKGFSSTISDAIMYATMNGPALEKKVKKACGAPRLVDPGMVGVEEADVVTRGRVTEEARGTGGLDKQLQSFLEASIKARGFYANLAEALCSDDSFAETRDTADCWNGHRVGEYTKALVRPGVDAQKYNPELKWREIPPDPQIRQLSDRLRHMRQVVLSRVGEDVGTGLESESLVREGSGSGGGARGWTPEDDEPDQDWTDQGSGSGAGRSLNPYHTDGVKSPYDTVTDMENDVKAKSKKKTGNTFTTDASSRQQSSRALVLSLTLLFAYRWHH